MKNIRMQVDPRGFTADVQFASTHGKSLYQEADNQLEVVGVGNNLECSPCCEWTAFELKACNWPLADRPDAGHETHWPML
jgi:hypothetical protein